MNKEELVNFFRKKRDDFPIFKNNPNLIYVDSASSSQKPQIVIDKVSNFYSNSYSNINRSAGNFSRIASELFEEVKEKVANFIGAKRDEIVFTSGATESLNLIAFGLIDQINKGDEIVLLESEHHANIVAWQEVANQKGAKIRYIKLDENFIVDLNDARNKINSKTKIVSIAHISNVLGLINSVVEIGKLAKQNGAIFVVDASVSAPHLKLDVKKFDCDFLFFSSHKMCGPSGVGVLFGKYEMLEILKPLRYGGGMICEVFDDCSTYLKAPYKFEGGTPNIEGVIGFGSAIDYLNEIGIDKIEKYENIICEYFLKKLKQIDEVEIFGSVSYENRVGIISFNINGIHAHDVSSILDKYNITVRGGQHCAMPLHDKYTLNSTCRISFYFYNTFDEIDKIIDVLSDLKNKYAQGEHLE